MPVYRPRTLFEVQAFKNKNNNNNKEQLKKKNPESGAPSPRNVKVGNKKEKEKKGDLREGKKGRKANRALNDVPARDKDVIIREETFKMVWGDKMNLETAAHAPDLIKHCGTIASSFTPNTQNLMDPSPS